MDTLETILLIFVLIPLPFIGIYILGMLGYGVFIGLNAVIEEVTKHLKSQPLGIRIICIIYGLIGVTILLSRI